MAVFEVPKSPEHGPYTATIGTDGQTFAVRIEPPFYPGPWVEKHYDGDGVNLRLVAVDETATMLQCFMKEDSDESIKNNDVMTEAIDELLKRLGQVSNKNFFSKEWERY